ncbi:MAG TPA: glycosyltransferase family 2 protein [Candidatus Acidoferrales bacterium]|nr:glycosyltransferase family 2 protein [Candidatus Acidoferrales bacterium]
MHFPDERISTIILNWNRADLLERTLRSYAQTVTGEHEVTVVDNASTDGTPAVLEAAGAYLPGLRVVRLDRNLGGEAINLCLDAQTGSLIHISENDQLFLAGWADYARLAFARFEGLGQLSLHGVVPTDEEAWEVKEGRLRFSRGTIVYETSGNVGTSSVLRAPLLTQRGIRVHNEAAVAGGHFKLPDDGRLSNDVKAAGFFPAWADRYYARNLGHELDEFERRGDYYRENYASKAHLGADPQERLENWQRRIDDARARSRVRRRSVVFGDPAGIQAEKTAEPAGGKSPQLWSMFDGFTAEVEVLDFVYALVRLLKPDCALETGTWLGRLAIAIAAGMRENGFGHLTTLELDADAAAIASHNLEREGLGEFVSVIVGNSLAFEPAEQYRFALFDSELSLRPLELRRFYDHLEPRATVVFHDTAAQHAGSSDAIVDLCTMGLLQGTFFETPRGLFVGQIVKPPQPAIATLRQTPPDFDARAYLRDNPDVAAAGVDAAEHYRMQGWREGRLPAHVALGFRRKKTSGPIVMCFGSLDDDDIVEAFLEYHLGIGVDAFVANDVGSTDGTLAILERYERDGRLHLRRLSHPELQHHDTPEWTKLHETARNAFGAAWCLYADSDEFWAFPGGDARAYLENAEAEIVKFPRLNFLPERDPDSGEVLPFTKFTAVVRRPLSFFYDVLGAGEPGGARRLLEGYPPDVLRILAPKLAARADAIESVTPGFHDAAAIDDAVSAIVETNGYIGHFQVRSLAQAWTKMQAVSRFVDHHPPETSPYSSLHWVRLSALFKAGLVEAEFDRQFLSQAEIAALVRDGVVARDDTISRRLSALTQK